MSGVRIRATVARDGTLTIKGLPSLAGHTVDVLVKEHAAPGPSERYPLRGIPIRYESRFDSVAEMRTEPLW